MVLTDRVRIVVAVFMVRAPMGPQAWHYMQYAMGLHLMGHDVTVVEIADDHEWTCFDPTTDTTGTDASYGLAWTARALERVGLGGRWAYFDRHDEGWVGPAASSMPAIARDADVFINISGVNVADPWFSEVPRRVFVDTDPGFVQIRNLKFPAVREVTDQHNVFMTFGERIGAADCSIPDDGYPWRPTRQPVVLDAWPAAPVPTAATFTTIMKWDSYRPMVLGDLKLGMKSDSFAPYLTLPLHTPATLEVIMGGPHPKEMLEELGWVLRNPHATTPDPWAFQDFVARSTGEFTVAKQGYVATRGGWFSERSANYLASGRPVITQETGFGEFLPTGEGLFSFSDRAGVMAALEEVLAAPIRHWQAARDVAAAYFDHRLVLQQFLDDVLS